jgi:hypothetical protein
MGRRPSLNRERLASFRRSSDELDRVTRNREVERLNRVEPDGPEVGLWYVSKFLCLALPMNEIGNLLNTPMSAHPSRPPQFAYTKTNEVR